MASAWRRPHGAACPPIGARGSRMRRRVTRMEVVCKGAPGRTAPRSPEPGGSPVQRSFVAFASCGHAAATGLRRCGPNCGHATPFGARGDVHALRLHGRPDLRRAHRLRHAVENHDVLAPFGGPNVSREKMTVLLSSLTMCITAFQFRAVHTTRYRQPV